MQLIDLLIKNGQFREEDRASLLEVQAASPNRPVTKMVSFGRAPLRKMACRRLHSPRTVTLIMISARRVAGSRLTNTNPLPHPLPTPLSWGEGIIVMGD